MSFRFNVLLLEAMIATPIKCKCDGVERSALLKKAVINSWHKFYEHKTIPLKIEVEGIEYELEKCKYQPPRRQSSK